MRSRASEVGGLCRGVKEKAIGPTDAGRLLQPPTHQEGSGHTSHAKAHRKELKQAEESGAVVGNLKESQFPAKSKTSFIG